MTSEKGDFESTLEICTSKIVNSTKDQAIFINGFNGLSLRKQNSYTIIKQLYSTSSENNACRSVKDSQIHTITSEYVYEDGIKIPVNTQRSWNQTYDVVIGGRGSVTYEGDIHSLRVYSRKLTDDEILYNQRVDNVRFNLGINLNGGIEPYNTGRELTTTRGIIEASPLESFDEQTTEQEECVNVTER